MYGIVVQCPLDLWAIRQSDRAHARMHECEKGKEGGGGHASFVFSSSTVADATLHQARYGPAYR